MIHGPSNVMSYPHFITAQLDLVRNKRTPGLASINAVFVQYILPNIGLHHVLSYTYVGMTGTECLCLDISLEPEDCEASI
jgi:hypothetical protein